MEAGRPAALGVGACVRMVRAGVHARCIFYMSTSRAAPTFMLPIIRRTHTQGSCPLVDALILLDMDGRRVAVKYFNKSAWPTLASELEFEKTIFLKTQRSNPRGEPDIQLLDNSLMVFKFVADLQFYAVAGTSMNEMVLASVLTGFYECASAPAQTRPPPSYPAAERSVCA